MPKEIIAVSGGVVVIAWRDDGGGPALVYAPDMDSWKNAFQSALTASLVTAIHGLPRSDGKLDLVLAKIDELQASINTVLKNEETIMADLTGLQQEVADTVGAEQSAIALIQGIEEQLKTATSQADIDALTRQLAASRASLAEAVAANPAPPAPAPEEAPTA